MPKRLTETEAKNRELRPRKRGTGSIFWRADRQRYQVTLNMAPAGAKADRRSGFYKTAREAEEALDALNAEKAQGRRAARDVTFGRWIEEWLAASTLKPNTVRGYRTHIDQHLEPNLGKRRLNEITTDDVRALHTAMRRKRLSPTTIGHAHRLGSTVMKEAVRSGKADTNPFAMVKTPKNADSTARAMNKAEIQRFEKAIEGLADEARWHAALYLGIRQGETLGLTWERVNLERGVIDLWWALSEVPYSCGCGAKKPCKQPGRYCPSPEPILNTALAHRHLKGGYYLLAPKSKTSRRLLPIPPWMKEPLERRRAAYETERAAAKHTDFDLVFSRPKGGPISKSDDSSRWHDLLKAATVESLTLHEARHTAASALMHAGADPKTIQTILGHSSYLTTMGYQHADMDHLTQAIEGLKRRE